MAPAATAGSRNGEILPRGEDRADAAASVLGRDGEGGDEAGCLLLARQLAVIFNADVRRMGNDHTKHWDLGLEHDHMALQHPAHRKNIGNLLLCSFSVSLPGRTTSALFAFHVFLTDVLFSVRLVSFIPFSKPVPYMRFLCSF